MLEPPSSDWLPFCKIFGLMLLALVAALSYVIAVRHVEQATSYGLEIVLGALAVLAGNFAQWAFGGSHSTDKKD